MGLSGDFIRTRGNKYKLIQHHCYCDLRKFNFANRVIPIRNNLSDWAYVVSSNTVNTFKHRVDRPKYWFDQDEKYN